MSYIINIRHLMFGLIITCNRKKNPRFCFLSLLENWHVLSSFKGLSLMLPVSIDPKTLQAILCKFNWSQWIRKYLQIIGFANLLFSGRSQQKRAFNILSFTKVNSFFWDTWKTGLSSVFAGLVSDEVTSHRLCKLSWGRSCGAGGTSW